MSDVAATNCGCDCGCGCQSGGNGCNIIWLILILCCCGGGNGCGGCFGNNGCGNGCGCDIIWILLLLCCCGGGNGGFCCSSSESQKTTGRLCAPVFILEKLLFLLFALLLFSFLPYNLCFSFFVHIPHLFHIQHSRRSPVCYT